MHSRLQYAASRTQQCSHLLENFVHEHFEGKKCSDYYDIYENKRLGKGSYGAVYLCKHKRSGDEYACKVSTRWYSIILLYPLGCYDLVSPIAQILGFSLLAKGKKYLKT
jgi:hypothetical protein